MKNINKKQTGFTLIELLVVISIMGLLFLMAVPNYRQQQRRNEVKNAAKELRSLLWEAQSRALAPSSANTTEYKIILPNAGTCGQTINLSEIHNDSTTQTLKTVILKSNVCIKNIKADGLDTSATITYLVGDNRTSGLVRFYNNNGTELAKNSIDIQVYSTTEGLNYTYNVNINKAANSISLSLATIP
ncbi:MAG TPA: prepilin-type N-terminal cleavage/methylation domain-containing protein [Patescibacteria group bacterium]|nr:prepilin-type N-terminal cleavage/methylation domain-containing protein [Patescibacteria group bacterium]